MDSGGGVLESLLASFDLREDKKFQISEGYFLLTHLFFFGEGLKILKAQLQGKGWW